MRKKKSAGGVADGSYCEEIPVTTIIPQEKLECQHLWVEGVDENGDLVEPPYDVCYHCGEKRL